ncbi:MAG: heavy metal sensor histidine kinase [Burkholderiaceae bacterium]
MNLIGWFRDSLIGRLSLLYGLGTMGVLGLLGLTMVLVISSQIAQRDALELSRKSDSMTAILAGVDSTTRLDQDLHLLRDLAVGHHNLEIGVMAGDDWLIRPDPQIRRVVESGLRGAAADKPGVQEPVIHLDEAGRHWLIGLADRTLTDAPDQPVRAVAALDVTESRSLVDRLTATLAAVGLAAAALIGLLTWWVAGGARATLARIAASAEQVTADALTPLSAEDAPIEIRGLVTSINRMLDRLHQSFASLEHFSADIAHELRTPVNAMMTRTQVILSRDRGAEEYREGLHASLEELDRLQRMITDMLFIARAERGLDKARVVTIDLGGMAREVADYFEEVATENGQRITITGELRADGDPLMLRRALVNLMSNATRYGCAGADITVSLGRQGPLARLSVANDCDEVFTQAQIEHLFDRFVRHGPKADQHAGLGLGLSMVASIMRLHGGHARGIVQAGGIRFELCWPAVTVVPGFPVVPATIGEAAAR